MKWDIYCQDQKRATIRTKQQNGGEVWNVHLESQSIWQETKQKSFFQIILLMTAWPKHSAISLWETLHRCWQLFKEWNCCDGWWCCGWKYIMSSWRFHQSLMSLINGRVNVNMVNVSWNTTDQCSSCLFCNECQNKWTNLVECHLNTHRLNDNHQSAYLTGDSNMAGLVLLDLSACLW